MDFLDSSLRDTRLYPIVLIISDGGAVMPILWTWSPGCKRSSHISRVARSFASLASKHMCSTTRSNSLRQAQRHEAPGCWGHGQSGDRAGIAGSAGLLGGRVTDLGTL